MNACPVYRRAGGLSYGATYSGPIRVILDPGVNLEKYRELPFHSSLCGSCSQVCPVQINIADQIYKLRREVAEKGLLKLSKKVSMSAIGAGPEISVEALEKTLAIPERSGDIKFRSVAR
jgi:L-lactate dehydrogenase complex protein LldF